MRLLTLLVFFLSFQLLAQKNTSVSFGQTDKTSDQGWKIERFLDGYIILDAQGCDSDSFLFCLGLFHLDKNLNILWKKEIQPLQDEYSINYHKFSLIVEDSIIIVATDVSKKDNSKFLRLYKINENGDIFLEKDLSPTPDVTGIFGITSTQNGYLCYFLQKNFGYSRNTGIAVLDKDFNILRYNMVGDKNFYSSRSRVFDDGEKGVFLMQEIIGPFSSFWLSVTKVDTALNLNWRKTMEYTTIYHGEPCFDKKGDTLYAVWRYENTFLDSSDHPPKILLLDTTGTIIEERKIYTRENKRAWLINVQQNKDIILTGRSTTIETGMGWFFVSDSTGKIKINKTISDIRYGQSCRILDAKRKSDGSFVLVGSVTDTIPSLPPPNNLRGRIWLLTLDSLGCWNGNCRDTIFIDVRTDVQYLDELPTPKVSIAPNPATDRLTIEVTLPHYNEKTELVLSDITGKELIKTVLPNYAYIGYMDVSQLSAGMYILQL